jgi:hypothetical protein
MGRERTGCGVCCVAVGRRGELARLARSRVGCQSVDSRVFAVGLSERVRRGLTRLARSRVGGQSVDARGIAVGGYEVRRRGLTPLA